MTEKKPLRLALLLLVYCIYIIVAGIVFIPYAEKNSAIAPFFFLLINKKESTW